MLNLSARTRLVNPAGTTFLIWSESSRWECGDGTGRGAAKTRPSSGEYVTVTAEISQRHSHRADVFSRSVWVWIIGLVNFLFPVFSQLMVPVYLSLWFFTSLFVSPWCSCVPRVPWFYSLCFSDLSSLYVCLCFLFFSLRASVCPPAESLFV